MLNASKIPTEYIELVKRHLNITWDDDDTDARIQEIMLDAEYALNHKLGAEVDYFGPGQARRLYLDYCMYAFNDSLNEFDKAYLTEILQLRHIYEVQQYTDGEAEP